MVLSVDGGGGYLSPLRPELAAQSGMIKESMRWLLLLILLPQITLSQGFAEDFLGSQSSLVLFPSFPSPNQTFTVSIDDYSGGAFGAGIEWKINGTSQSDAKNQRELTLTANQAGEPMQIEATLTLPNGSQRTLQQTFIPRYLDIIFEPQTHVPGFYRGRPLPSQGSQVNATALLSNTTLSSDNLVYTWRIGNKVLNGGPLRGQNKVSFSVPMGREIPIGVEVTNEAGEILARRTIAMPSVTPEVKFYEVNTLYGIKPSSLTTLSLFANSGTIQAVPFYLDSRVYNQPDIIRWQIDRDEYTPEFGNPYQLTLQRNGSTGGSRLDFNVRSTTNFLQFAQANLTITY